MAENPIERLHLLQIKAAYKAGFVECLDLLGEVKPYMSRNEADKRFGAGTVQKWIDSGLVNPVRDGKNTSKWRINRKEIELVASMSNYSIGK